MSQWVPSVLQFDTIPYAFRTGGDLDTVDKILGRYSSTMPGGGVELPLGVPDRSFFWRNNGLYRFGQNDDHTVKYSGLPHLGFAYVFGTQGTQVAKLNYQQVYGKKVLANFNLSNDRSNGFLRFGSHRVNRMDLNLLKKGEQWSMRLTARDLVNESSLNGGMVSSADASEFPLVFLGVNKRAASSKFRRSSLKLENYFDFNKDSTRSIGLLTEHTLNIDRRTFNELDTVFGIYPEINFDSLQTNDSYQYSRTDHALGIFKGGKDHYFSLSVSESYWKYYHPGTDLDSLETALHAKAQWRMSNWVFNGKGYFNLIGSGNEWDASIKAVGRINELEVSSHLLFEQKWPMQFQRSYLANNYSYVLGDYDLQFRTNWSTLVEYNLHKWTVFANYSLTYLKDNYFFDPASAVWSSSFYPELIFNSARIGAQYSGHYFSFSSDYMYTLEGQSGNMIPDHILIARGQLKGTLFKSKKLKAYIGSEFFISSGAEMITFIPSMDTYILGQGMGSYSSILNVHVFGGFQIDEFRFFVRFENLGYLWNDRTLQTVQGYPFPSGQLRLGITWDFFN